MRHSTYLEVCLPNIAHNIDCIRRITANAALIPMVKGNAYGHGIGRVSQYIHDVCGVRKFAVASLGEALTIVRNSPAIAESGQNEIIVFSDNEVLNTSCQSYYHQSYCKGARLTPVLGTTQQVKTFCTSASFNLSRLFLKINTGMNRIGLQLHELDEVVPLLRQRGGVDLLLQHFAVAGHVDRLDETLSQYNKFEKAKQLLLDSGVEVRATSVSNSGAIEQRIGLGETYVRSGIMLYGQSGLSPKTAWGGRPASYLYTKVLTRFPLRRGDGVGYGLSLVMADCVVVMLAIGYGDGFLREYKGMPIAVTPEDAAEPIIGTVHGVVSMDTTAVVVYPDEVGKDIGSIMNAVKEGSRIIIWGDDVGRKGELVGSINYQLMCAIGFRVPRLYVEK